jgi:putative membrane protein insertion efficiency factor
VNLVSAIVRLPRRTLIALITVYRFFLSPWIGQQCRFYPTCSVYAEQAIERHGAAVGTYLGARRILRCHPWCEGGLDPVPERRAR